MPIPKKFSDAKAYKNHKRSLKKDEVILTEAPFYTVQGEGKYSGVPAHFIRFSYCSLLCNFCSIGSTNINTEKGNKQIKNISVGEKILSYNEKLDLLELDEVIKIHSRLVEPSELLSLTLEENGFQRNIIVTKDHRFYIKNNWVEAQDIQLGEEIYTSNFSSWKMINNNPMFKEEIREKVKSTASINNAFKRQNDPEGKTTHRTEEHKKKYSLSKMGSKNPRYLGNNKKRKINQNYNSIRQEVLKRDNYKCQHCSSSEKLEIHHIDPYRNSQNDELDNLLTLCKTCHIKEDNRMIYEERKNMSFHNGKKVISKKTLSIKQIAQLSENKTGKGLIRVYSLETKNNHNYFTNTVLSHNCDSVGDWDVNKKIFSYEQILSTLKENPKCKLIVITGGEPAMQINASLLTFLKNEGYVLNIETSGSYWNEAVKLIDYVCCSPKRLSTQNFYDGSPDKYIYSKKFNEVVAELKFIVDENIDKKMIMNFLQENRFLDKIKEKKVKVYLSPMDLYDKEKNKANLDKLLQLVLEEPNIFTISLQTHKILGVS